MGPRQAILVLPTNSVLPVKGFEPLCASRVGGCRAGQWRPCELRGRPGAPQEGTGISPGKMSLQLQDLDKGPGKLREPY